MDNGTHSATAQNFVNMPVANQRATGCLTVNAARERKTDKAQSFPQTAPSGANKTRGRKTAAKAEDLTGTVNLRGVMTFIKWSTRQQKNDVFLREHKTLTQIDYILTLKQLSEHEIRKSCKARSLITMELTRNPNERKVSGPEVTEISKIGLWRTGWCGSVD